MKPVRTVGALVLGSIAGAVLIARQRRSRTGVGSHGSTDVPLGARASRTAQLAKVGGTAGARMATMNARSAFASDERKAELKAEFELQTAAQVADVLGNMKGAVMKLGQMASYLDQGMPEPVREALAQLQQDAPPMSGELAASVIRTELGHDPDVIFAEWDAQPLASASIGQVHRAVTHEGQAVAVKVQYPGVDEAIRADLNNSDVLFGAMGMLFPGMDPKPIVSELRERLTEELDYRIEADHQRRFARYYQGHPTISVPAVVERYCTARVLCTELATGAPFSEVVKWPAEERNLAAETIFRYAFSGIYRMGAFNGDPHPGNYLFGPGGQVTFLDYGLCKVFTKDEVSLFEDLIQSMVLNPDPEVFLGHARRIGFFSDTWKGDLNQAFEYFRHFYEFVLTDEVMTITPEYASESVRRYFDLTGPYAEVMKAANVPKSMVIIQRINLGLFAVLAQLGATANWRRLAEEIWPFVGGEPSTPMGHAVREWEQRTHDGGQVKP